MRPPAEENLDEAPDSPPQVPMHFMNGYRGWHIVFEGNQEVIELVTTDEEDEVVDNVIGNVVGDVDPMMVFWDIEMGHAVGPIDDPLGGMDDSSSSSDSDEEMDVAMNGNKDVGIQCNLIDMADDLESDSSTDESAMDSDDSDSSSASSDEGPAGCPPSSVYVCGGRGRFCVRGRAVSSSRYVCGGRGRHCLRGGTSRAVSGIF